MVFFVQNKLKFKTFLFNFMQKNHFYMILNFTHFVNFIFPISFIQNDAQRSGTIAGLVLN